MNKINVLILGGSGQLAACFIDVLNNLTDKIDFISFPKSLMNITDKKNISNYLSKKKVDYLINCAAYTDVPRAEVNEDAAIFTNGYGPKVLAECCLESGTKLIHFSTDFAFGGSITPETEDNTPNPLNTYGKTKVLGEQEITKLAEQSNKLEYMIIRTSWLYSEYGKNFVKTILKKVINREDIQVVVDQIGSPTYAKDLAKFVVYDVILSGKEFKSGIYHYSNQGNISWYDFANAIAEIYNEVRLDLGGETSIVPYNISPSYTSEANQNVKRPRVVMLDKRQVVRDYDTLIPYWRTSLKNVITKLVIDGGM